MLQVFYHLKAGCRGEKGVAMALANLSFPIHELTWEHYWVVMEELGLSETETTDVLTKVLGPVACLHRCFYSLWAACIIHVESKEIETVKCLVWIVWHLTQG